MREIKFRAWQDEEKIMFEPEHINCYQMARHSKWPERQFRDLMQYTGLKDKNGKEIYEGDIIRIVNNKKTHTKVLIEVVSWNNEQSGFWPFTTRIKSLFDNLNKNSCEVVGNIHENPELIK